jgi:ParB family chromosome partitioning protein
MNHQHVLVADIDPDPNQPRKGFRADKIEALAASLKDQGQQVPIILRRFGKRLIIVDGGCRFEAAKLAGLKTLAAVVLDHEPNEAELLALQLTCNLHRTDLTPLERLEAYRRLMQLQGWSATQLAAALHVSKSNVSATLALAKLDAYERDLLAQGKLSFSGAYALTHMTPEQRRAVHDSEQPGLKRDQLQATARRKGDAPIRRSRLTLELPQADISIASGEELDFAILTALFKELRHGVRQAERQGLDPRTWARVLHDRANRKSASSK